MDGQTQRVWIPPLPQGWEARFDHNQRRYFFLNHLTKETQWEDPRFNKPSASSAASSLGSKSRPSHSGHSRGGESVAMRDLSPRHSSHSNRGNSHQAESSLSSQANTALINKLHREFPRATKELITDLFQLCHENERETREQLKDLGFLKDTKPSHPQPTHQKTPEVRQPAAKPEPSEHQKRQLGSQLKSQFPKLEENVINIALTTCDYDIDSTKRLIEAWNSSQKDVAPASSSTASGPATSTSSSTSSRPSTSTTRAPVALEPAGLGSSEDTSPRAMRADVPSGPSPASRNNVAGPSQATRGASPSHQPPHLKARQVTKMSEHLLNTTSDLLNRLATTASCCDSREDSKKTVNEEQRQKGSKNPRQKETVVTSQPSQQQASHTTVAKGPDASLRKGPDSSLLIADYESAHGPDRSLHQGPDRSRVGGPMGAHGADPTLRCGPQSCLVTGGAAASQRLLVSNI